jgi:uncharacterized repeat protein (TIGR01451 family)
MLRSKFTRALRTTLPPRTRQPKALASVGLSIAILTGMLNFLAVPAAAEDSGITVPPGVTVTPGGENCSGVVPTPGSANTLKVLDPGSGQYLNPGGEVGYLISFPTNEANVGDFEIVDCVLLVPAGGAPKDYTRVLEEVSFHKVNNSEVFELAFTFDIPADVQNGDQICNVAKTTASPSKSPASNRKAGPACFVIGGSGRVEKQDKDTGELLDGATFNIHGCVLGAGADPTRQPILISLQDAAGNSLPVPAALAPGSNGLISGDVTAATIAFNGPSGSSCLVTEVSPPPMYLLPPVGERTMTVLIGARAQTRFVFQDPPVPPALGLSKTADAAEVNAGEDIGFTITVSNTAGAGTAKAVTISDPLPSTGGLAWVIDPAKAGCNITSGTLSCAVGDLVGGASFSVHVKSPTTGSSCGEYTNTASVASSNGSAPDATAKVEVLCPGLALTKSADAATVDAGDQIGFTIGVGNTGEGTATDVEVTDVLPTGSGISWSITPAVAGCGIAGGTLTCDFGDLTGGQSRTVHVVSPTTKASCATYPNTATLEATIGSAPAADAQVIVQCPNVTLEKDADDSSVSAGESIGFTITAHNAGPATADSVVVQDNLPSGGGLAWSIGSGLNGDDCSIAGNTLTCSFGDIPAEQSRSVHITSETTAAECRVITNTASATVGNGQNPGDATDTVTVQCPDLSLEKEADALSVSSGDQIGFTITVRNGSEAGTAFGVTLNDPLPTGDGVVWTIAGDSADGSDCGIAAGALVCDFGHLITGAVRSVHVTSPTTGASCKEYPNTATVDATNAEAVPASDSTTVLCPGIEIGKSADAPLVDAGGQIGFTIEVRNSGPGVAKDVVVTDELPGSLEWSVDEDGSDLPEGSVCDIADGVLTCQVGDLPAVGENSDPQVTIHLVAQTAVPTGDAGVGDCASYVNTASAEPSNGEGDTSPDVTTTVRCPIGIDLTKTGPTRAHVGDTVAYQFTVMNIGFVDLVDVSLVDPICDGDIVLVSKGDGDALLEIDTSGASGLQREVWTYRCVRVVRSIDPDPLPNTATVSGTDADQRSITDTASWSIDVIHPAISIVKTANPESVSISGPVTYTYVVTNTGDTMLLNVTVTDDILGGIGTVGQLAPGESITMTKTVQVDASTPPTNIGTAVGTDVLGQTVSANDDAVITVVLPQVLELPAELPRTGSPLDAQTRAAIMLIEVGIFMTLAGRRRRAGRRVD